MEIKGWQTTYGKSRKVKYILIICLSFDIEKGVFHFIYG